MRSAPALAVGSFRAAVSFGVSEQGRVRDAHLLDSSGDADRDEAITQALNGIALGRRRPRAWRSLRDADRAAVGRPRPRLRHPLSA